jgi:hypothetical protein
MLVQHDDGYTAVLAPGNGQLDLSRRDYANTLMRVEPGLDFDPGCGDACADFDPDAPSPACVESCRNLFIPRDYPGDPFPLPESGACDGLTLFQCWQELDYLGGSTPAPLTFEGRRLLAYPAKDGALYLIDENHLGRLYDRRQLVAICGTRTDACRADWAGMIVTEPVVLSARGELRIVVPTFMPDRTHAAGVVGLSVRSDTEGLPRLVVEWQYPPFGSPESRTAFREHPSRASQSEMDGVPVVLLVDVRRGSRGRLLALGASDGALLAEARLAGPGYRVTKPLVLGDRVVVPSCDSESGPSHLEVFRISRAPL